MTLRAAVQSGSWSGLNTGQSSALVTGSVFSLQMGHGTAASGGTYSYTVLPKTNSSVISSYAAAPTVRILSNTRNLQATRHDGMALMQAAFYVAGTLATGSGTTRSTTPRSIAARARRVGGRDEALGIESLRPRDHDPCRSLAGHGRGTNRVYSNHDAAFR